MPDGRGIAGSRHQWRVGRWLFASRQPEWNAQPVGDGVPRVAIVHDYLTQRGGAERVALEMTRAFPGVPLYTTVYNAASTFSEFAEVDVRVVPWLDRVSAVRRDPRLALPV